MDVSSSVFSFALDWSNSMHTIISTHNPKEISLPNRFFPDTSLWQPVDFLSPSLHSLSDSLFHLHNFFFFLTSYRLPQTAHSLAPHNNQQPTNTKKRTHPTRPILPRPRLPPPSAPPLSWQPPPTPKQPPNCPPVTVSDSNRSVPSPTKRVNSLTRAHGPNCATIFIRK